jgi:prepilin-type N-terminal cleavage/methylation domain-containing protein
MPKGDSSESIPLFATLSCRRGMTLIEIVVVLSLAVLIIAAAAASIGMMRQSSDASKLNNDLQRIVYGINEYQMISKNFPAGSSWPTALNDFVDSGLRSGYSYKCDSTTGNVITITSVGTFQSDPTQKLKDQNMCTNDSYTVYNANKTVTCRPVIFSGQTCS